MPFDFTIGRAAFDAAFDQAIVDSLLIRRKLTGSQWAEQHGYLPAGTGAETGRIKLYGYQRGVLDAMCDPTLPIVTVPKAARVGYTRLLLLATAYHIEHDPSTCVIVQPSTGDAEDFGRSEIVPMLRDTPSLSRLVRSVRKGDAQDTLTEMFFSNAAVLRLRGAASDDAFRRYPARFQAADEVDGDNWSSGGAKSQGDKLKLLWTRGETYWNRKQIRGGTPVVLETSRIWREWLLSDQRRYFVPCPHCNEMQYLDWGGPDIAHGIKWALDDGGALKDVWYVCIECGALIDEGHKHDMDARGEWRPTAVGAAGHAGFHIWTGMGLHPNAAWPVIVQEWIDAQADLATNLQPFVNLVRGIPFSLTYGAELKLERLTTRREPYASEVPGWVSFITLGADVQSGEGRDPRIEASVYGWGPGHEGALIGHWILPGDPSTPEPWAKLDDLLSRSFLKADGTRVSISAACVDSGGHHTSETYDFCAARQSRRVWAIKGASEVKGQRRPVWPRRPTRTKSGASLFIVGGNAARDFVYKSLAVQKPGPRYMHFPSQVPEGSADLGDEFFKQMTRERLVVRKGGFTEWIKPKESHEAGVCLVYAYAAVAGLKKLFKRFATALELSKEQIDAAPAAESIVLQTDGDSGAVSDETSKAATPQAEQPKPAPRPRVIRNRFMVRR